MKKKKILIVVGTRPNFIKITQFEKEFNKYPDEFDYVLVHTNQHYDDNMSAIFFDQLKLKKPIYLAIDAKSPAHQIGNIIIKLSDLVVAQQPDVMIAVGDVNSTLAASIVANKTQTRLFHLESGLRSFDREMPEEINREITDLLADDYFITEQSGLDNLRFEEQKKEHLHFVGNTMIDTLVAYDKEIQSSPILSELSLEENTPFALMTMHRPRNVDTKEKLHILLNIISTITELTHLVFPIHPRTKKSLEKHGLFDQLQNNKKVIITGALNYLAFQKLICSCKYVITDSGGIQEETTFRQVPCLTLRDNTERPSTIDDGTNVLVNYTAVDIKPYIKAINNGTYKKGMIPPLWDGKATQRIVEVLRKV